MPARVTCVFVLIFLSHHDVGGLFAWIAGRELSCGMLGVFSSVVLPWSCHVLSYTRCGGDFAENLRPEP